MRAAIVTGRIRERIQPPSWPQSLFYAARRMKKLREGDLIGTFEGHEDGINCLAIAADESVLVSGSEDGTARIWDLEAEEVKPPTPPATPPRPSTTTAPPPLSATTSRPPTTAGEKSETETDVNHDQGQDHVSKCLGILK